MDKLLINTTKQLSGSVKVSASKNASLPILAATLLYPGEVCLNNLPHLSDVNFFLRILESLGAQVSHEDKTTIHSLNINHLVAEYDLVRKMRASVLVLGPMLSRFKKAQVSLPGGCAIGTRPVDIHLSGMEALGAEVKIENGYIYAHTSGLIGTTYKLPFPSVGATENLMMAAFYAKGETTLENVAREPEIVDLANFLNLIGGNVTGAGTSVIKIKGVEINTLSRNKVEYSIIGDRIEAATFIIAALMLDSEVKVEGFHSEHIKAVTDILLNMGAKFEVGPSYVIVKRGAKLKPAHVETQPYPGFPTDVQAQLTTLMGMVEGESTLVEHIFENRFMHVPELNRMGMDIKLEGNKATIHGVEKLSAAPVMCTDLRASAALILAGLKASGETVINRIYHLDRGYENIEKKFEILGAKLERVK